MGGTKTPTDFHAARNAFASYLATIERQRSEGATTVGIDEHADLARGAQALLERLAEQTRATEDYRGTLWRLSLVCALRDVKRKAGRPRKITLASLALGPSPKTRPKHRPREYSGEFLAELFSRVEWQKQAAADNGERISAKEALRREVDDFAKEKESDDDRRAARVTGIVALWEPELAKYRQGIGKPIYTKLGKSGKFPNNSTLANFWPRPIMNHVQQPPVRGKGKHGDAKTTPIARGKGPNRVKP